MLADTDKKGYIPSNRLKYGGISGGEMEIVQDLDRCGFVYRENGTESGIYYRLDSDGALELYETFVDPALRGRGLAAELVMAAIKYAEGKGLKLRPTCPYAIEYFKKHPQFDHLLQGNQDLAS